MLNAVGGIALFILGMKIMSDGAQRISEGRLKTFLNSVTGNKYKSLLSGLGITTVMQSSSAVSVLILSFINAGILNLHKAFPLILGANIGTTIKLWIISFAVEIQFSQFCLPVLALFLPFYFSKNSKIQGWSTFVIGFSLIFLGLDFLRINLESFTTDAFLYQVLTPIQGHGFLSRLYFLAFGILITFILQSSSASTSVIVILFSLGIPLDLCLMMIIGANIGTTSTVQMAATVGNIYTKYTAYFHTAFNLFGAFLFSLITPFFYETFFSNFNGDGYLFLALFHTGFNLITAILIFPFLNLIINFANQKVQNYGIKQEESHKTNIGMMHAPFSISPEMYIYEANRKLHALAGNIKQSIMLLGRLITESDDDKFQEIHQRIINLEKESDQIEHEIGSYLSKIMGIEIRGKKVRKIHHLIIISKELENIGDLAIKTSFIHIERRNNNLYITPKLRTLLIQMQDIISLATTHLIQNINEDEGILNIQKSKNLEQQTNDCHRKAFDALTAALHREKINPMSALYYRELILNYEIIGDHIFKANQVLIQ